MYINILVHILQIKVYYMFVDQIVHGPHILTLVEILKTLNSVYFKHSRKKYLNDNKLLKTMTRLLIFIIYVIHIY